MKIIEYYHPIRSRPFLIKSQVAWTDILRKKQRQEEIRDLQFQLQKASSDSEKECIQEAIRFLQSEVDQWVII